MAPPATAGPAPNTNPTAYSGIPMSAAQRAAAKMGLGATPPVLQQQMERADARVAASEADVEKRAERSAEREGDVRAAMVDDMGAMQARQAQRMAEQRAREEKSLQHVDALAADVRGKKIDPDHFYGESKTGGRIMAGIAMALGAYASAINKGPNYAMEIINKRIDDDIAAQRANLQNARENVADARGLYAQLRQKGLDDTAAENGAKAAYLENAQMKLEAMRAGDRSADMQARYKLANDALEQAKLQARADAYTALKKGTYEEQQKMASEGAAMASRAHAQAVEDRRLGQEDRKIDIEEQKAGVEGVRARAEAFRESKADRALTIPLPNGGFGQARSEAEAAKYREKFGAWKAIDRNIEEAQRIRTEIAGGRDVLANLRRLKGLENDTMQSVTVFKGQGAMSEGDARVAREAIGGVTSFMPGRSGAIQSARDRYRAQFDEYAKAQIPDEKEVQEMPAMRPAVPLNPVK
ncbi:MAG: hypothetical protein JOZ84_02790 [Methylobacteriaceae bacterium]|nr:hypothetical protein [Solirubrobacterales bacterium]MBV9393316.1 hypothetical protein [Methylobacteriaceae bacterium]